MDIRKKALVVDARPQIAQESKKENKKTLIERLNDWVDTIMPDRF